MVNDRFDVALHDEDVLVEIELSSDLMIAASEHAGPLSEAEIDRILGVR